MNRKHIDPAMEAEQQQNGQYAVVRNRKWDIIAACVCLLLAVLAWLVIMNRHESDFVVLRISEPSQEYEYELSVTQVEIEGTVNDLRKADAVEVVLPQGLQPGEYKLNELSGAYLDIPDGVTLNAIPDLKITVEAK